MNRITHYYSSFSYLLISLVAFSLLSSLGLLSNHVFANTEAIDQVYLTVPVACTMSGTGTTHTATLNPGTYSGTSGSEYENGIGKTTLTAICNDNNGFSIYAIGYTGNSYDSENHTKLVGTSIGSVIATKAYASGDTTSNWSMKLTKVIDTSESYNPQNLTIQSDTEGTFSSWHSIPAAYSKVAEYHANTGSSTTDTTLGAKVETTYAAFIASNQPADTYSGQVKYIMVHPYSNTPKDGPITNCPANKICYSPNANDVEGTMGQQSITASTTSTTLLASNFSRTGYGFAGWSDRYDYSNTNGAKFYGPDETINFGAGQYSTTNGGLRLYAIWLPSVGSLQDSSKVSELCGTGQNSLIQASIDGNANLDSVSALTDQRDGQTYAIAKLADGNCWMIENLRLEAEATRGEANKNLAQGYGASTTYGNFIGLADAEYDTFGNTSAANSVYYIGTQSGTAEINIGTNDLPNWRMPRYDNSNTAHRGSNVATHDTNIYGFGNYYSWAAAVASTIYYQYSNNVNTSLCPNGWMLPIGNKTTTYGSFGSLSVALGGPNDGSTSDDSTTPTGMTVLKAIRSFPNNYVYSGHFGSSILGRGSYAMYWSANSANNLSSFYLRIGNNAVKPGTDYIHKILGQAIRCTFSNRN